MALSEIDRTLLERCLARKSRSWEDFVDRFLGLVIHVINHAAQSRSIRLTQEDREDLVADILLAIVNDDFCVLRRFRGECSLATYLTVVGRRIVVRQLLKRKTSTPLGDVSEGVAMASADGAATPERRMSDQEEVERLLAHLNGLEADVVRMYHLEGKSYQHISATVGMPENSIGPTLTRARSKMRRTRGQSVGS